MGERTHKQLVQAGKKLLAEEKLFAGIKWNWADLALEVEPSTESRARCLGTRPWPETTHWRSDTLTAPVCHCRDDERPRSR